MMTSIVLGSKAVVRYVYEYIDGLLPLSVTFSKKYISRVVIKGALAWYGKLTWESAHSWILKIVCYLIVCGITLIFMVRLSFYAIPLLIYDVMNDITIIP